MRTLTETTRLVVAGGHRFTAEGGPFRAVRQAVGDDSIRIALVPDRALLLAGDTVRLEVVVAPGAHLHLVETSGTVAYDMRGGRAVWEVAVAVGAGATFVHETLPWVSAAGSDVRRSTTLALEVDAAALVRETLVLGRHGEVPGRLLSRTVVSRAGREVLVEDLDARDLAPARVLDGVLCVGTGGAAAGVPEAGVTRLETESGDVLHRALALEAHVATGSLDRVWAGLLPGLRRTPRTPVTVPVPAVAGPSGRRRA